MGFFQPSGILNRRGFFGESAAAPFNPASISGLALWLKADAGVTLSGASVTQWADQSANGLNAIGNVPGAVNPEFVSNVQNGKPIIRFGIDDGATVLRTNPTTFGNSGEFTIFSAYDYNDDNNIWAELISKGDLSTAEFSQISLTARFINSEDPTYSAFGVMGGDLQWQFLLGEPAITSWAIVCGIQSISNNLQEYYINGSMVSSSSSVAGINQLNISIGIGNSGIESPFPSNYGGFRGDLAEIIFYNRKVTNLEREQVESYLNNKYDIY
jgi:hypothetical protein